MSFSYLFLIDMPSSADCANAGASLDRILENLTHIKVLMEAERLQWCDWRRLAIGRRLPDWTIMQAREHEGKARVSGVAAISVSADVASGMLYTCPMHPEIRSDRPGNCPKCGITLEPLLPELDRDDNAELKDFSRRFWWTCR
jgi:hypothetical protein